MEDWRKVKRAVFARRAVDRRAADGHRDGGRRRRDRRGACRIVAAGQHHARSAAAATVMEMGLLLVYWQLMARYYDRNCGVPSQS